jgi:flagellar hook-associated protein 2
MSSVSTSPLYFTGISKYSSDLQTILTRAVGIASIPLTRLQNQESDLLSKKQLLTDLSSSVTSLSSVLTSLGTIGDNKGIAVSSSNANIVAVSLSGTATPGVHTITNITSVAKAASETSATGFATADTTAVAPSGVTSLQLVVGDKTYDLDVSDSSTNNLNSIRDQINKLNAGVSATVLNTGTGTTPYFLSLTADSTGSTALQLRTTADDAGTNILTSNNQGADAVFTFDGLAVTKKDNVVNDVLPGVTFTIAQKSTETVTISLDSQRSGMANALNSLVTNYNAVRSKVNAQIGQSAGLLSGDFIVREVQNQLQKITGFNNGSSTMATLADLGIELSRTGEMSFKSDTFYSLSNANITSAFSLLNSTDGLGQLGDGLTAITDPLTGLIKVQQDQYDTADKRLVSQATTIQDRISAMQVSLLGRLQAADALLASLTSQQSLLTANITALNYTVYGKTTSS